MELSESTIDGVVVVAVKGRLDSGSAPLLADGLTRVLEQPGQRLVIDLSPLEYVSSAGFRVLLMAAKRAAEGSSAIVLTGISGKIRQLFDLGGFLELFKICSTRDEGIDALH